MMLLKYEIWPLLIIFIIPLISIDAQSDVSMDHKIPQTPFKYSVTKGAAPGYIDDKVCQTCHFDIYTSYKHVGMAQSFFRPHANKLIEDFTAPPYFHPASQRYYQMKQKGNSIIFKRYQIDNNGKEINVLEKEVDWIMGAGNTSRTYIYQTKSGELYQLPICWYTETQQWAMAPGYDNKHHEGILRGVRRECMFCHNAYPDVPKASDNHWHPHTFPKQLPEGIGCQRCHGPGAKHIQTVLQDGSNKEDIMASIINPSRLSPERRDDVCLQCHMLPAVGLVGVRRFERSDYSFQPGEALSDYMLHVDIEDSKMKPTERFEINHHAYRLQQSACFQKSKGALTCTTCHNPHHKVPQNERSTHYNPVCLRCHEAHTLKQNSTKIKSDDCVLCHMPQRRTQDVVHVIVTDHNIQRNSASKSERLALLKESLPIIKGLDFLIPQQSPIGAMGEVYKAVTLLRTRATADFVDRLEQMLLASKTESILPYFDLALGQIMLQRLKPAEQTLYSLLKKHPNHPRVLQWMGIIYMKQGKINEAKEIFQQILSQHPESVEVHFNLGLLLIKQNNHKEAVKHLKYATSMRSNFSTAWFYLAKSFFQLNQLEESIKHYKHTLEIDPSYTRAYLGLVQALFKNNDQTNAIRFLNHARKTAKQPEPFAKILTKLSNR